MGVVGASVVMIVVVSGVAEVGNGCGGPDIELLSAPSEKSNTHEKVINSAILRYMIVN